MGLLSWLRGDPPKWEQAYNIRKGHAWKNPRHSTSPWHPDNQGRVRELTKEEKERYGEKDLTT